MHCCCITVTVQRWQELEGKSDNRGNDMPRRVLAGQYNS